MAKPRRKLKSFRLSPDIAGAIEQAAKELPVSEGEIVDFCVARSIDQVVKDIRASGSRSVLMSKFTEARSMGSAKTGPERGNPAK